VAWLASDELEGRRPGTPGSEAAVDYVESVFRSLGLEAAGTDGTYRQPFGYLPRRSAAPLIGLTLNGAPLSPAIDIVPLDYSGSGVVHAEIVFVGYGITIPPFDHAEYPDCPVDPRTGYDDYQDVDARGRLALVMRMGPRSDPWIHRFCPTTEICREPECLWHFGYKAANASLHGAAGLLVMDNPRQPGNRPQGGSLQQGYYQRGFPAVYVRRSSLEAVIPELADRAATIDTELGPESLATGVMATLEVHGADEEVISTENLLGVIRGSDPVLANEVIVVGAHIDHLGRQDSGEIMNGADDNASGTAVMLELARLAAGQGAPPARTMLFAAWNAEEDGLLGSCYFVSWPTLPLRQVVAAFSVDMVGAGNGEGLVLDGGAEPISNWLVELMERGGQADDLPYQIEIRPIRDLSDHQCFFSHDIPAILATTPGLRPTYHTPRDTPSTIRSSDLEAATRLLWSTLLPLSQGLEGDEP
jgi:hypothetical protein